MLVILLTSTKNTEISQIKSHINNHHKILFPEGDRSFWNFDFAIVERREISLSSPLRCFTFDLRKLFYQELQMTWQHFASSVSAEWKRERKKKWKVCMKAKEAAKLKESSKTLKSGGKTNGWMYLQSCLFSVRRTGSVCWVVVREEVRAMLGFFWTFATQQQTLQSPSMAYIEIKRHSWQKELCSFMSLCILLLTSAPGKEKKESWCVLNLHWHSSWHCLLVLGKVKVTSGTCPSWDISDAQLPDTSRISRQPESKHGLKTRKLPVYLLRDKLYFSLSICL